MYISIIIIIQVFATQKIDTEDFQDESLSGNDNPTIENDFFEPNLENKQTTDFIDVKHSSASQKQKIEDENKKSELENEEIEEDETDTEKV